ncbi:hypothetical protein [Bacillus multifaciens]|uniref:hypothetical protein n=1 Tax=Bacillus multifaciens TaxID=3068506 RepID=UPI0027408126|nr:hypothetical protein [Bacillus sp. WLY-B-L8]MDP7977422.1 hypothetical protein [Bacillus sp. WLY-B-L8]
MISTSIYIQIHFIFSTYKPLPSKIKGNHHLLPLFVFTTDMAKKGPDRFYARPGPLASPKEKGFLPF